MKKFAPALLLPYSFLLTGAIAQQDTNAPFANTLIVQPAAGGLQITDRTDQERIEFLLNVAAAYADAGNVQGSIDAYNRVLEIDPDNRRARFNISQTYISTKQYAKAETLIKELIEEFPDDYLLKNNLAWLYATAEDPTIRDGEKAIQLAQEAMVLAPYDFHVWSTLAEAYYVTGQYEKAYRAITHMADLAAQYGKGITKEMVDSYNEQIRKCKRAWDSQKALNGLDDSDDDDTGELSGGDAATDE